MGKHVLTWGWFGFHNLGDDLLLYTFIRNVRTKCPDISLSIAMKEQYDLDESIVQVNRSYKTLLSAHKYDALVIGPGGIFPENKTIKLLVYLIIVTYWKIRHKQILFFGVGISESMNTMHRFLWHRMVKLSGLFLPRSESVMKAIGLQETDFIHSMPDSVFAMQLPLGIKDSAEQRIGIAVANLTGNDYDNPDYQQQIAIWSNVIASCINLGKEVDLIAFTKENDDVLIDALGKKHEQVRCIYYSEIDSAIDQWSNYEAIIAMRFHSVVLSILSCTPFVPIAYGHKTCNLAEKVGMGKFLLRWSLKNGYFEKENNIDAKDVVDRLQQVLSERKTVIKLLREASSNLKHSADRAYDELCAYLNG